MDGNAELQRGGRKLRYIRWIWRFWYPHRTWLLVLAFLTLLSSAVTIGYPLVFRYLIDALNSSLAKGNQELAKTTTWNLIGIIAVIGLARSLAHLYPGVRAIINAMLEMDIRNYYFSRIIEKGYKFFQKFRTGDLVTRLTDDIGGFPKIAWFMCSGIFRAVESSSKFIFCVAFMLAMDWRLTLLSITPLPVMLYLFYRFRIELGTRAKDRQRIISRTNDALESAFSGVRIVKAFNAEENQEREFGKLLDERIDVELKLLRLWMGISNLYFGIEFVGQIIVIVAGGIMVIGGTLSLGELYAFYVYLSLLFHPLMDIPNLFVTARQAFASIDREIEIEETIGGTEGVFTGSQPLTEIQSVVLRDVDFRFENSTEYALKGINIEIKKGEWVSLVGVVGSGKSTLLKVLAGIIPPTKGEIIINGKPIDQYRIEDYRSRVGYVPQEATLFSETVKENVKFGRDVKEDEILEAMKNAQIREEMEQLPKGLEQVLGQRGLTVSGGQKQRLAIARALIGKPDLLLMDDVTSSLDAENERKFWQDFKLKYPHSSCAIVTHRLATAMQADVIYVMSKGEIVAKGNHHELLSTCEEYRSFLTREELEVSVGLRETA